MAQIVPKSRKYGISKTGNGLVSNLHQDCKKSRRQNNEKESGNHYGYTLEVLCIQVVRIPTKLTGKTPRYSYLANG